jgi:hypothetical protein
MGGCECHLHKRGPMKEGQWAHGWRGAECLVRRANAPCTNPPPPTYTKVSAHTETNRRGQTRPVQPHRGTHPLRVHRPASGDVSKAPQRLTPNSVVPHLQQRNKERGFGRPTQPACPPAGSDATTPSEVPYQAELQHGVAVGLLRTGRE